MKKKTFLKVLLCLMLCAAVLGWFQLRPYQVEDDGSNLEEQLTAWHERDGSSVTLTPLDTLTIGDVRYVTYEMEPEGRLFYALLLRGPNGRWKLEHSRGGTQLYLEEIREIGGTPYLIFLGKNIGAQIASVEVKLESHTYALELPPADHFLVSTPVELSEPQNHVLPDAFHYFDETGQDISDSVYWNGFPPSSSQQ